MGGKCPTAPDLMLKQLVVEFQISAEVKWAVVGASGGPNALDADQDISSCAQAQDSQKPTLPHQRKLVSIGHVVLLQTQPTGLFV
jgi:hypothetical protein